MRLRNRLDRLQIGEQLFGSPPSSPELGSPKSVHIKQIPLPLPALETAPVFMKTNSAPTHEEISHRAREIWQQSGSPDGRDTDIWLAAERQLMAGSEEPDSSSATYESPRTTSESRGAVKLSDRIKSKTAGESLVEHHLSPAPPDESATKAALQKKQAREPKYPARTNPKAPPAETGKPLWDRPHSS